MAPQSTDEFWNKKKDEFLASLQQQGLDFFACKDYIDNRGVYSFNQNVIKQNLMNPNYRNPLKRARAPPQQMMMPPQQM